MNLIVRFQFTYYQGWLRTHFEWVYGSLTQFDERDLSIVSNYEF